MKLLFDFFPIVLFFISYKLYGVKVATAVMIVASIIQIGAQYKLQKKVENMHIISLIMVIVLGGLTIWLDDKRFVMWKPTIFNGLIGVVFAATTVFGAKPLIQRLLESQITLPQPAWRNLSWSWVGLFFVLGAANLYFAQRYLEAENNLRVAIPSITAQQLDKIECDAPAYANHQAECIDARDQESLWVNFKLFGVLGLIFVFIIGQSLYLSRHISEDDDQGDDGDHKNGDHKNGDGNNSNSGEGGDGGDKPATST